MASSLTSVQERTGATKHSTFRSGADYGLDCFATLAMTVRERAGNVSRETAGFQSFHVKQRGIFITCEGMDGSGKTTQMHRLAERLRSMGRTVMETVEPGGPPISQKIRRILLDSANQELSPTTEILLYFASRAQNVDQWILPALGRGETGLVAPDTIDPAQIVPTESALRAVPTVSCSTSGAA